MGLFNNLMSKIFNHATTAGIGKSEPTTPAFSPTTPGVASTGTTAVATAPAVDIVAVLSDLAAKNPEKLDWKHSIVDLMKLVGMDSSFAARKELAQDLNYTGNTNDSAAMNIWLQKQVMLKLSQNGGKVPAELLK
ncbi:MAG TPA: DUF3597 domain-containing protein [Chthoniobacterales bacterium]|nr:DUF3597 domain-containing protein [Chthoniobacterales bacterium]